MLARERIAAFANVRLRLRSASEKAEFIRGLTNWHQLGGTTPEQFKRLRDELAAAVDELDTLMVP